MNENIEKMDLTTSQEAYRLPLKTHGKDMVKWLLLSLKKSTTRSPQGDLRRFVIFGQGRCGSTLLASLLDSHPGVNCQDELLKRFRLFPLAHLEWQAARSENHILAFGFHLKPWHITRVLRREPRKFMRRLEGTKYKIVHLERENIFLQSLSQSKLFMHRIVHAKEAAQVPENGVSVDTELLLRLMRSKNAFRQLEEDCLAVIDHPVLSINYESGLLNSDAHQGTCETIFDFLGIDLVMVGSPYKKVSPLDWRSGVTNAREVESAVAEEGFGNFIEMADRSGSSPRKMSHWR